jgi:hypothetical protein
MPKNSAGFDDSTKGTTDLSATVSRSSKSLYMKDIFHLFWSAAFPAVLIVSVLKLPWSS